MKKRKKHSRCLNCSDPLDRKFNYCPNCGQENTDNNISVGLLFKEFTSNFFSLDSRFARTFKPFLFNPGKITNAFIEGKRVFYANPIRWYLVISLIHFFFVAKVYQPDVKEKKKNLFSNSDIMVTAAVFDSLYHAQDTSTSWPLSENKFKMANYLAEQSELTPQEILDSIQVDNLSATRRFTVKQIIKINQESRASLNVYLLSQIPIIIFFILPIYALLLKLFYWKKGLYIKHLIHSIHIHSFFFFVMGLLWIAALFFDGLEKQDSITIIGSSIAFIYIVVSCRNVYKVKWIWSFTRSILIGIFYSIFVSLVFIAGILISLAVL